MRDLKKGDSAAEENLLKIDDSFEHFNEIFAHFHSRKGILSKILHYM